MIEVKGTRTATPNKDPTDPLGFRKVTEVGNGPTAGLVTGLVGLAVYLRSFLWFEPKAALAATSQGSSASADEGPRQAANRGPVLAEEDGASPERASQETNVPADTMTMPIVLGSFKSGIFVPLSMTPKQPVPPGAPANSTLPPFDLPLRSPRTREDYTPDAAFFPIFDAGQDDPDLRITRDDEEDQDDDTENTDDTGPARNRAPRSSGPVYLGDVGSGATLAIALSHLLSNSSDPDGDRLTLSMGSSSSGAMQPRNGDWRYVADDDQLGDVQIVYEVSDGTLTIGQTAIVTVVENEFLGTEGADLIVGTEGRDRITALAGDDAIASFGGRDVVFGGAGDDNISGGAGNDTLFGDAGDDLIAGGDGDDLIFGGEGHDRLYGQMGNDEISGDAGDDLLDGGAGHDTLTGGEGNDSIIGGEGDDLAAGGAGQDEILGGAGRDVIFGDEGNDALLGGAGEDVVFGGLGDDLIDGGVGNDVLAGDSGDDTIGGGDGADLAAGGEGNDQIRGGAGDDKLLGDAGRDVLDGGAGNDTLAGGTGADTLDGGLGDDLFIGEGDSADDHFVGSEGFDVLSYIAHTEGLTVNLIEKTVSGLATGDDSFAGIEAFIGSTAGDTFRAAGGEATMTGNGGADLYSFVQGDTVDTRSSLYHLLDFDADDRINLSNASGGLEIRRAQSTIEDRIDNLFEDFSDRFGADQPRLRYFHEWTEEYRRTQVEVDFDRDNEVDLILVLEGEQVLDFSPLQT